MSGDGDVDDCGVNEAQEGAIVTAVEDLNLRVGIGVGLHDVANLDVGIGGGVDSEEVTADLLGDRRKETPNVGKTTANLDTGVQVGVDVREGRERRGGREASKGEDGEGGEGLEGEHGEKKVG